MLHKNTEEFSDYGTKSTKFEVVAKKMDGNNQRAITKEFFPKIEERLKLKINVTPKFTVTVTGHCNIKAYVFKYKIRDDPKCL